MAALEDSDWYGAYHMISFHLVGYFLFQVMYVDNDLFCPTVVNLFDLMAQPHGMVREVSGKNSSHTVETRLDNYVTPGKLK